tara:strand:- start:287 stop:2164 length:1878 start_codon:yes stop_codon:yes gene_type:complete
VGKLHDRRRRKTSWILTTVITIIIVGILIFFSLVKDDKTQSWYTTASLSTDGVLINEIIDNDFGNGRNRGIWRDIPGLSTSDIVDISSPTANDDTVYFSEDLDKESRAKLGCLPEGTACIRIGDPDILWRGLHRYELTYKLPLDDFTGTGRCGRGMVEAFCWNAAPERWAYEINEVRAQINNADWLEYVQCRVGNRALFDGCQVQQDGDFIYVKSFNHPAETPLIISAEIKSGASLSSKFSDEFPISPPSAPTPDQAKLDVGTLPYVPLIVGIFFLGILLSTVYVRRLGRDVVKVGGAVEAAFADSNDVDSKALSLREMTEMVTLSVVPPEGIEPYEASIILYEQVTPSALQSWFLQQSINGHISIEGKEGEKLQYLSDEKPEDTGPFGAVFSQVFGRHPHETKQKINLKKELPTPIKKRGRKGVDVIYEDASDRSGFIEGWRNLDQRLENWFETSDYWVHDDISVGKIQSIPKKTVMVVSGFGAVLALSEPNYGGPIVACICSFIMGLMLPAITHSWELLVRSPKGSGLWLQIEGFRRFLHTSEQHHVEEASKKGLLRQYTAWAVALGEIDHWKKAALNALTAKDSTLTTSDIYFASSIVSMASAASYASSSSGGGGGGGGGGW